jgi:hypothetical protein
VIILKRLRKNKTGIFKKFINLAIDKKHPVRSMAIIAATAASLPALAPVIGAYAAGKLFYKAVKIGSQARRVAWYEKSRSCNGKRR